MYRHSFNYLVLVVCSISNCNSYFIVVVDVVVVASCEIFTLMWGTWNVTYLAPHLERNSGSTSTVCRENNLTANRSSLNVAMTPHSARVGIKNSRTFTSLYKFYGAVLKPGDIYLYYYYYYCGCFYYDLRYHCHKPWGDKNKGGENI